MKRIGYLTGIMLSALCVVWMSAIYAEAAQKQTIYNSPYVTFAPDRKAWTTNAGEKNTQWYDKGTAVSTGISSSLRSLKKGEHYYAVKRTDEVPVGKWVVELRSVNCCHNSYPVQDTYHGISYNRNNCLRSHYSGWNAYCADCGEKIADTYVYMSKAAAESIDYLEVSTDMEYYYLCPHCNNLEQGRGLAPHSCKAISWNQYKVTYDANTRPTERYGGYMADSIHMYNNATKYEGNSVTPVTHLTENAYTRTGYEFVEWNTEPDGSGTSYQDGQEIVNLSLADWNDTGTWTNKDKGVITLYAQWRPSASTLRINPNGGSYHGKTTVTSVTGNYGSNYKILNDTIKAPKGYTISFNSNGGSQLPPIVSIRKFTEWSQSQSFRGKIKDDVYYFIAPDGNVDTITANYELDSVTLPDCKKTGSSFGGWYYDAGFSKFAGNADDKIIPTKNITLYARWVDLKLSSKDNYTANGGKGAVDLSWTQSDNHNKIYKIYQSRDEVTWNLITSETDIGKQIAVSEDFTYTGKKKTYTVPYTGLYTLTAYGARGENYDTHTGGKGGKVTAQVWLREGEKLTYAVGGQNGYNGGGTGSDYGNGGGSTVIVSDKQGTLLVAGGGGGAGPAGNGGKGGSSTSLRKDKKSDGADGIAGGGAGYVGGNAGELIVHHHTDDCYQSDDLSYTLFDEKSGTINSWMKNYWNKAQGEVGTGMKDTPAMGFDGSYYSNTTNMYGVYFHSKGESSGAHYYLGTYWTGDWSEGGVRRYEPYWAQTYIPTKDNTQVNVGIYLNVWEGNHNGRFSNTKTYVQVYDQNNRRIFSKTLEEIKEEQDKNNFKIIYDQRGSGVKDETVQGTLKISLPKGTTHIYIALKASQSNGADWFTMKFTSVKFIGGKNTYTVCGYEEGQVLSSKPAYGGSSYVNTDAAYDYSKTAGARSGDGAFSIRSKAVGYLEVLSLSNVIATDYAAPNVISEKTVTWEPMETNKARIIWQAPKDNGTAYYHVAESYPIGSTTRLCRSNVTKNTLTSGIAGYYTLTDTKAATVVTAANGSFITGNSLAVSVGTAVRYLHVAAVDKAGNVGGTAHIRIEAANVQWKLCTEQLLIEEEENIYPAGTDKTWYVRADGTTPFMLKHQAYMDGPATLTYQPNYTIYESFCAGMTARNVIRTPSHAVTDGEIRTDAKGLFHSAEGKPALIQYPYSYTIRFERGRRLSGVQKFTLEASSSGKHIKVIPVAGAEGKDGVVYSDAARDKNNGLTLIGDGEAPVISGLEPLENAALINRNDGTVILDVNATDTLSGVGVFYLEIINADNGGCKTYTPGEDGRIRVEITKDESLFSGDFVVTAFAADNVGNEAEITKGTTEFVLNTKVERILEPHDPIFKCGESGILTITTWGYADRVEVEFPEEFASLNPGLNRTYLYMDTPQHRQEEQLRFMIPLYAPADRRYTITVRAYKGDKKLEDYPSFSTIAGGTILDEFHTRLR